MDTVLDATSPVHECKAVPPEALRGEAEAHLEQVLHTILLLVWQVILAAQQKTAGAGQHNIGRLQELDLVNALSAAKQ